MPAIPLLHVVRADKVGADRGLCDRRGGMASTGEQRRKGWASAAPSLLRCSSFAKALLKAQPYASSVDTHTRPFQVEIHHSPGTLYHA